MDFYDSYFQIGCCLLDTVYSLLEEDEFLRPPKYGGPSHAGNPSFCCDSMWYTVGDSFQAENANPADKCSKPMTRDFTVTLTIPACSEAQGFKGCEEPYEPCPTDMETGCADIVPWIPEKCDEAEANRAQETAYIQRARMLIECEGCARLCECFSKCLELRCETPELVEVRSDVQGGCAYIDFVWRVTW